MDELFEKLSNLKIESKKEESNTNSFIKTGLLEKKNQPGCFKVLLNDEQLQKECIKIQGRELNATEINTYNNEKFKDDLLFLKKTDSSADFISTEDFKYSLGSALELVDQIVTDKVNNGIGFFDTESSGYIVPLMVKFCIQKHNIKRILVVNWDSQHDLTLQEEFYENKKVLNMSIHRSDNSDQSDFASIGGKETKDARGFNVNIPLNEENYDDTDYMAVFHNIVLPITYEFSPQFIIISTSFDANSPKGNMNLSSTAYEHFINYFTNTANGKICLLINDSNSSKLFNENVSSALNALLGRPCRRLNELKQPKKSLVETVLNVVSVQRPHWYSLQLLNESDENLGLDEFLKTYEETKKLATSVPLPLPSEPDITKVSEVSIDDINLSRINISMSRYRTCVCSDETMMKHFNLNNPNHPENPERIKRIKSKLKDHGLYELCSELPSRKATKEELQLCHPGDYIERIQNYKNNTEEELLEASKNNDSVYYHWETYECATLATGCLLSIVDDVCTNKSKNGFGIIRPPGHHANADSCSGFCFFNSIGIAARYAQKKYEQIKKVLILDFDVHHGNGTQDLFEDDDSVLFISLHRYDDGFFYPANNPKSNYDFTGVNKGKGFTINVPWNQPTAGDSEYVAAFLRVVMPVAYQFNPDLVLVSAGFDAAIGDPLGGFNISPNGFAQMTKMLSFLADGKVVMGLEGGYNLSSISESVSSCVSVLLGDTCPSLPPVNAKPQAFNSIKNVTGVLKSYWSCFQFGRKLPSAEFFKKQKKTKLLDTNGLNSSPNRVYSLRTRNLVKSTDSSACSSAEKKKPTNKIPPSSISIDVKKELLQTSSPQPPPKNQGQIDTELGMVAAAAIASFSTDTCTPFAVVPLTYCPHLEYVKEQTQIKYDISKPCSIYDCGEPSENWICLTCNKIYCSRYINNHMVEHYEKLRHPMALSFSDLSVWCYECDSYVHNQILNEAKQFAYMSKFGKYSD